METIREFADFVREIRAQNGSNYKKDVLERYKDNDNVKFYLKFLLNPYVVTGISEKKLNKQLEEFAFDVDSNSVTHLLHWLSANNTGTDHVLQIVQAYRRAVEDKDVFDGLVTKNLPLGVNAKTVNEVIPCLVPTFNVQLANKYFDKPAFVEGKKFSLTTKIDGGRIIAIKKDGQVKFYTRQGQEYEGLVDLKLEMQADMPDNICLDGEITLFNKGNLTSKEQYKQTMKITRKDGEKHGVKMLVFDCMTADEFYDQHCSTPYCKRRQNAQMIWGKQYADHKVFEASAENVDNLMRGNIDEHVMKNAFDFFELLPLLYVGEDTSQITEWLNKSIAAGEEGVMINIWDAPYTFDRTSNLLKVKKMNDVDLEVVGFEEGRNALKGKLGAVLCRYKGNIVQVGSGFTNSDKFDIFGNLIKKDERKEIWEHQDKYLGKIMSVQYFEETTNAQGGLSLRFPVFLDFRDDKTEADF